MQIDMDPHVCMHAYIEREIPTTAAVVPPHGDGSSCRRRSARCSSWFLRNCAAPHEDPRAHAPSANALRGREARRNEEELPKEHLEAPFLGDAAQRVALPGRHGCPLAPKAKKLGCWRPARRAHSMRYMLNESCNHALSDNEHTTSRHAAIHQSSKCSSKPQSIHRSINPAPSLNQCLHATPPAIPRSRQACNTLDIQPRRAQSFVGVLSHLSHPFSHMFSL